MLISNKISDRIFYYLDIVKIPSLKIKIDHFKFDENKNEIIVNYRLGRQKLLNEMNIPSFEKKYFEKISGFDQLRLTKFSTLQQIFETLFNNNHCTKEMFNNYIKENINHERLF